MGCCWCNCWSRPIAPPAPTASRRSCGKRPTEWDRTVALPVRGDACRDRSSGVLDRSRPLSVSATVRGVTAPAPAPAPAPPVRTPRSRGTADPAERPCPCTSFKYRLSSPARRSGARGRDRSVSSAASSCSARPTIPPDALIDKGCVWRCCCEAASASARAGLMRASVHCSWSCASASRAAWRSAARIRVCNVQSDASSSSDSMVTPNCRCSCPCSSTATRESSPSDSSAVSRSRSADSSPSIRATISETALAAATEAAACDTTGENDRTTCSCKCGCCICSCCCLFCSCESASSGNMGHAGLRRRQVTSRQVSWSERWSARPGRHAAHSVDSTS